MKARALLACGIVFLAPAVWAGESVLYSVTEQSVAYPAANRPVRVSVAEDKTDVFAIDPETGKKRLVFSDANAEFMLLPGGRTPRAMVAVGGRIFSVAVDRQAWANNAGQGRQSVYELSTDGSGKARKVFDIEGHDNLFISPSGEKIGYFVDGTAEAYVIRETATGKLLRTVELQSGTIYGGVSAVGWMPDDRQIFFSLQVSGDGDDAFWNKPGSPIGTYVMGNDDAKAKRLAPEAELHFKVPGKEPDIGEGAKLIGVLPGGQYLFRDSTTPLYALDLGKKTQKIIPTNEIVGSIWGLGNSFHLSLSGRWIALAATQEKHEKQPRFTSTPTVSLWVLQLESGEQAKLVSFPPMDTTHGFNGPWINLVGWLQD